MPGGVSVKLVLVVAAFAFVGAFRLHAGADDEPARAAATLSGAGASALASDTASAAPVSHAIAAPSLTRVPALPALHRAPAKPRRKAPVHVSPAATPVPTAVATVAPVTPRAPVRAPSKPGKSYVGKSFDSKG